MRQEGWDQEGIVWVRDLRYDDFSHIQDFENFIVSKVINYRDGLPEECWEATIFEDEKCQKIVGRELFNSELQAKRFLETYLITLLKNHKNSFNDDRKANG